jgi:hypothetical protein
MRFKEAETAQADLGRTTVAIFYEPRCHDMLVVTFDARHTYIMTDGFGLPSCRETADYLSKCLFSEPRRGSQATGIASMRLSGLAVVMVRA